MCRSVDAFRRLLLLLVLTALASVARAAQSAPRQDYKLPAGDAAVTLRQFVEQSGEQLLYLVPKVRGARTNPVDGKFTAREALDRMLTNSGLAIVRDDKSGALLVQRVAAADDPNAALSPQPTTPPPKSPPMPTPPRKNLSRLAAALALMVAPLAEAQTPGSDAGVIQGRVYNPVSKEYVRDAEVRLEGTNQVTFTENDGSFRFNNVTPGPASLAVTYSGYNTVKQSFTVTAGSPAVREINLTSTARGIANADGSVQQMEAFTVASEREGNSKATMAQRRNMDISTSVASDIFGDVMDGNVGEFIKYLPGVDLDYVESLARGPRLGGMDSQYVGVSFDGTRIASADSVRGGGDAGRSTSFEGFSITAVESIEISRTTSAESDADTPAGTINMKTKRAFDRKGRRIGFNGSISFNAEEFTLSKTRGPNDGENYKWRPNLTLEYSEAFLNQRLGVLLSVSSANSYTEQYDIQVSHNRTPTDTALRPLVFGRSISRTARNFTPRSRCSLLPTTS